MSDELCSQRALLDDGPGPCLRMTTKVTFCLWCGRELGPDARTVQSLISAEERARVAQWIEASRRYWGPENGNLFPSSGGRLATATNIAGADLSGGGGGGRLACFDPLWFATNMPSSLPSTSAQAEAKFAELRERLGRALSTVTMKRVPSEDDEPITPRDFSTGGPCLDDEPPVLDELRIEIGLWLADRTKDHETIRALGRLLGVDMGGGQ
jgi:hypothetical protein